LLWALPEDHDPSDKAAAYNALQQGGIPVGVIYQDESRPSLDQQVENMWTRARTRTVQQLMDAFEF
jgi:ABC-type xylose transport system substrate-binding protein